MRSVEASARTRQEAIKKALDMLGVELHEVDIEIIDEGSRGLFGIGARDVKVRVAAEGLPDEPKPRRHERAERPERTEKHERPPRESREERAPREAREERPPREGRQGKHERPARPERQPKQPRQEQQQERQQQQPKKQQHQRQKPKPVHEAPEPKPEKPAEEKPREEKRREEKVVEPGPPISDARREEAAALLGELIAKMSIEATVTSHATEDGGAHINVDSPDSALLIGRKGKNLEALQYLINRMMTSAETSDAERFVVDIEHYLDRRREGLEDMARQLAQKAKETGRDVRVKPLSPQERRIIHLTLQDDPEIRTFSLGAATMRHVVISPKNAQREEGGSRRGRGSRGGRGGRGGGGGGGSHHRGGSHRNGPRRHPEAQESQSEPQSSEE